MVDNNSNNPAEMSKEEKIGYFKGALATLVKERAELSRLVSIVEQIMASYIEELKTLGIDLAGQAANAQNNDSPDDSKDDRELEDIL